MRKGVTGKEFTLTSWKTEIVKCRRARTTWTLCKRRTGEAIPRAAKCARIGNNRAQSLHWDLWIGKQSPIRYNGAKFGSWKIRDETKLFGADLEAQSHLHWQCLGVWHKYVKLTMELLRSLRRHLIVQKKMGLLNSGTLNRGRNLCVTVAIDHSTVDGFHDELQLSAKKYPRKGASTKQLSQRIFFGSLAWVSLHFCFLTYWNSTNSEAQQYPKHSPNTSGTRGDLEQVDKNRRVRIPQRKAQREGDDLDHIGDNSKDRRWTIKISWRRSGSENIHLDRGQRTQNEEKFKKTFLESQTGFHQPPKQEVIAHQHSLKRKQWYPHQNCFEKDLGKLVMNFFNKQTCPVYYR